MIPTVFDSPQFQFLPDPQHRQYANVDNRLQIARRLKTSYVTVAIPTGLFLLMRSAFNISTSAQCSLAIDEFDDDGEQRFVLSLFVDDAGVESLYDLWTISRGQMPPWMLR